MRRLVLALLVVLVLAGCGASAPPRRTPATADLAALRTTAALAPCPSAGTGRGPLPAITLTCLGTGTPVAAGTLRGPMLVNVWASWCQPCYAEMPYLQQLHARAGARVTVLGVDTSDTDPGGLRAAHETGVHYPSLADPHRRIAAALGISTQPTTLFVRADGSIAAVVRTPATSLAQLVAMVQTHLGIRV